MTKFKNEEADKIINKVARITANISSLPDEMLESKIREYFEGMKKGKVLSIDDNQNGV